MSTYDFIIAFESGEVTDDECVAGFAELIRTGLAWTLQGFYGRTAVALIEAGLVDRDGNIL